jgi:hypothetical protein
MRVSERTSLSHVPNNYTRTKIVCLRLQAGVHDARTLSLAYYANIPLGDAFFQLWCRRREGEREAEYFIVHCIYMCAAFMYMYHINVLRRLCSSLLPSAIILSLSLALNSATWVEMDIGKVEVFLYPAGRSFFASLQVNYFSDEMGSRKVRCR